MSTTSLGEESTPFPPNFLDDLESLDSDEGLTDWINGVLRSDDDTNLDLNALDKLVSRATALLDISSEDLSSTLERLIDDISRSASRLSYDLQFMRDGAVNLQTTLTALNLMTNSSRFNDSTDALKSLHQLDIIKSHMEAARDVLQEAESWSTLESEVTSLLVEQTYEKAAERLSEANKSLTLFQKTPDFEQRRALITSLQNQLEASLSSSLVAAINSQDISLCRTHYTIFHDIQRDAEFRSYYYGSRRSALMSMWQDASLIEDGVSPSDMQSFSTFLPKFFSSFLSTLAAERPSISAIFPDPRATLATFITSTVQDLQPSFADRLSAASHHGGTAALLDIIASFQATEEFAVAAEKIIESIQDPAAPSDGGSADHLATSKSHSKRHSRRLSLSLSSRMSGQSASAYTSSGIGSDWDQPLFEPFLEYQMDYGTMETRLLAKEFAVLHPDSEIASWDGGRGLRDGSVDAFRLADEALGRVQAFTHGYGLPGFIKALDQFFESFLEKSRKRLSDTPLPAGSISSSVSTSDDLADLDYTLEDWRAIRMRIDLLEAVRGVLNRLILFETRTHSTVYQSSKNLRSVHGLSTPIVAPGTARGEMQLLASSTLNSVELQDLLKRYETPSPYASQEGGVSLSHPALHPESLLTRSHNVISTFTVSVQKSLQDAILSPLRKHLSHYASSPLWTVSNEAREKQATSATSDIHIPLFSLSPSDIMQHVAEGLLNLPRLFEVYAVDDVFSFSMETLPFLDRELFDALLEQTKESQVMSRRQSSISVRSPASLASTAHTPEAVTSIWLSSLGHSILSHLTSVVLPGISSLTSAGSAQLAADLDYLSNIVGALNVHSEELKKWRIYVSLDDSLSSSALTQADVDSDDAVFRQVARVRGWRHDDIR
ncbi:hypothetical protein EWM64_g736 [Hericium alpestre]|uniref:Conserved oligomeric Golgi complex subunit 7 n=1 Tax=Hericium alpestre TaxID=135208 RepID=A0A4Z0A867_9AGAM|nr:hypothetical protein EWM64_g736 [Hericium alpestre]